MFAQNPCIRFIFKGNLYILSKKHMGTAKISKRFQTGFMIKFGKFGEIRKTFSLSVEVYTKSEVWVKEFRFFY